jgi:hypothetical protein
MRIGCRRARALLPTAAISIGFRSQQIEKIAFANEDRVPHDFDHQFPASSSKDIE